MKRIAIYSRKSKFTGKGESIENQIDECKYYIKNNLSNEEYEILTYEDEGRTGANLDRPEFKKMMNDVRIGKINMIICYRLDRLSRSVSDFSSLYNELQCLGVEFCSVKDKFDTTSPMGKAMMFISSVFAQLERDVIAERIRDNMAGLAKTGRWLGGRTPLGYKSKKIEKIDVEGKKRSLFMLDTIENEKNIIKLIFSKYIELKSQTSLETYLINNNIKTKNNINFSRFAIKLILHNPVYAMADLDMYNYFNEQNVDIYANSEQFNGLNGIMAYRKTEQVKGKADRRRDISEWIISVGKHEGFITGGDWVKVQTILKSNETMRYRRPRANASILTGLIRCGECGSFMRPKLQRNIDEFGNIKFSYMCELKDKSRCRQCRAKNVNGLELDRVVMTAIRKTLSPSNDIKTKLKELSYLIGVDEENKAIQMQALRTNYSKNQQEIDGLINKLKFISDDLIEDVAKEIKRLKEANKSIEYEINTGSKTIINVIKKKTEELLIDITNNYFGAFDSIDIIKKRQMLRFIIRDIEIKGDNVNINFLNLDEGNSFPKGECCK